VSDATPCGVIFDVDGVLLDSAECHRFSWYAMANELEVPMTDAFFYETFGQTNGTILKRLFGRELKREESDRLSERKEELFRVEARKNLQLFLGVTDRLGELKAAGYHLALGTSAPKSNLEFFRNEMGLGALVETCVCSQDIRHGKPNPEVFLVAAERLGIVPSRCVVVEDAIPGVEAAKAGGFKCIAVATTNRAEVLRENSTPDLILTAMADVTPAVVGELLSC